VHSSDPHYNERRRPKSECIHGAQLSNTATDSAGRPCSSTDLCRPLENMSFLDNQKENQTAEAKFEIGSVSTIRLSLPTISSKHLRSSINQNET